jgi:alanine racemase
MTKIIVDTKKLINNCKRVLKATKDYKYKIAVTKGNGYGHDTKIATKAFLKAGFKIFGLARYSECLETYEVVKGMKDITILSLSVVENENIKNCIKYGFIIPITSIEQIESYIQQKTIKNLKVQIALNTGMNRIGFNDKQKLLQAFNMLNKHGAEIVGVFSHVFENDSVELSIKQFDKYEELISIIPN